MSARNEPTTKPVSAVWSCCRPGFRPNGPAVRPAWGTAPGICAANEPKAQRTGRSKGSCGDGKSSGACQNPAPTRGCPARMLRAGLDRTIGPMGLCRMAVCQTWGGAPGWMNDRPVGPARRESYRPDRPSIAVRRDFRHAPQRIISARDRPHSSIRAAAQRRHLLRL